MDKCDDFSLQKPHPDSGDSRDLRITTLCNQ